MLLFISIIGYCSYQGGEVMTESDDIAGAWQKRWELEKAERERILELLIRNKVVRWDSAIANKLVFVNCDTLDVEYLKEEF